MHEIKLEIRRLYLGINALNMRSEYRCLSFSFIYLKKSNKKCKLHCQKWAVDTPVMHNKIRSSWTPERFFLRVLKFKERTFINIYFSPPNKLRHSIKVKFYIDKRKSGEKSFAREVERGVSWDKECVSVDVSHKTTWREKTTSIIMDNLLSFMKSRARERTGAW